MPQNIQKKMKYKCIILNTPKSELQEKPRGQISQDSGANFSPYFNQSSSALYYYIFSFKGTADEKNFCKQEKHQFEKSLFSITWSCPFCTPLPIQTLYILLNLAKCLPHKMYLLLIPGQVLDSLQGMTELTVSHSLVFTIILGFLIYSFVN